MDEEGNIREIFELEGSTPGYMTRMVDTCEMQINLVYSQNLGAIRSARSLEGWLELIESTLDERLNESEKRRWTASLAPFYQESANQGKSANEGGFLIRFNEWAERRLQHRWYLRTYGKVIESQDELARPSPSDQETTSFLRPTLPSFLGPPPVPSVLPFHTVRMLPLERNSAEDIRIMLIIFACSSCTL